MTHKERMMATLAAGLGVTAFGCGGGSSTAEEETTVETATDDEATPEATEDTAGSEAACGAGACGAGETEDTDDDGEE
jgi:hypothetical protein